MKRFSRWMATFVAVALVAAACTSSDSEATTTEPAPPMASNADGDPSPVSINDALGGTQGVQDFAIFVAMWERNADWPRSFYDDLVDEAASDSGYAGELSGGFGLNEVFGLQGSISDSEGERISSLRVDYGLLTPPATAREEASANLSLDQGDFADLFAAQDLDSSGLLVEVITADYSQARTHAGPGDNVYMDLTSVESLEPGDDVAMSYIFGQTLPGDPEIEQDLSPLDLFRYRWNQGLVAVLGDSDTSAAGPAADHSVEIIDGSTVSSSRDSLLVGTGLQAAWFGRGGEGLPTASAATRAVLLAADEESGTGNAPGSELKLSKRQIKQLILLDTTRIAEEEGLEEGPDALWNALDRTRGNDDTSYVRMTNGQLVVYQPNLNEVLILSDLTDFDPDCEGEECPSIPEEDIVAEGTFEDLLAGAATAYALEKCEEKAAKLNKRNGAQTHVSDFLGEVTIFGYDAIDQGDDEEADGEGNGGDPLAPKPGPVGCTPGPPSGPPKLPTGSTWGDIHHATMDGRLYSNQAAGEFLLLENDATTIQVRTEPRGDSDVVSIATAFAFSIGDHSVSLHAGGQTWIDGEAVELERGATTAIGGGELLWWAGGWVAVWPDGTILRVTVSNSFLFSTVTPSAGGTIGLLGDNDGNPENDFFTRDGEVLSADADDDFEGFYSTYVDSWRITDQESLFNYRAGERTATFSIAGFPARRVTADDFPLDVSAEAERVCTEVGVTSPEVLETCILDVAVTDDPEFAYHAFLAQEATAEPPEVDAGDSEAPTVIGDGDTVLTVGDLTIVFGAEPPILDPSGPAPKWTCELADGVFTAMSRFQETPTILYELDLQYIGPDNSRGFDEQFRLIVNRNAEPYAWVQTNAEQFSESVESVSASGGVLTATGEMYVNEPPTLGLGPISQLPADSVLTPFTLQVSCDG